MRLLVLAVIGAIACGPKKKPVDSSGVSEVELTVAPDGLSGLGRDADGVFWSIAEGSPTLVRIDPETGTLANAELIGARQGLEFESLTFLADGRMAIGTETDDIERSSDVILIAARESDGLRVVEEIVLSYTPWNVTAPRNEGIEGLCVAGQQLVAVCESPLEVDGKRYAMTAIRDLDKGTWRFLRLRLSSKDGKIAGIACRPHPSGIEFVAIERHYPVRRLLRGVIEPDADVVSAEIALDVSKRNENFEGIEWTGTDSVAVVSDNFFGGRRYGNGILIVAKLTVLGTKR